MADGRLARILRKRSSSFGDVTLRPLPGGHGVCSGDRISAVVFPGRLYSKVDERSSGDYQA